MSALALIGALIGALIAPLTICVDFLEGQFRGVPSLSLKLSTDPHLSLVFTANARIPNSQRAYQRHPYLPSRVDRKIESETVYHGSVPTVAGGPNYAR